MLFLNDLLNPSLSAGFSIKPWINFHKEKYYRNYIKDIKVYCIKDGDNYLIHGLLPREHNDTYMTPVYYDIIFYFTPIDGAVKTEMTIRNYSVEVFSNSPSWIFNFTYLYNKGNLLPKFIPKRYYSEAALKEPPKEKNKMGTFGPEKSTFMILFHLDLNTSFRKNRLDLIMIDKIKPKDVLKQVMSQDEKLNEIDLEKRKLALRRQEKNKGKSKEYINPVKIDKKEDNKVREKQKLQNTLTSKLDKDNRLKAKLETTLKTDSNLKNTTLKKR
jgi:hypothetical protein